MKKLCCVKQFGSQKAFAPLKTILVIAILAASLLALLFLRVANIKKQVAAHEAELLKFMSEYDLAIIKLSKQDWTTLSAKKTRQRNLEIELVKRTAQEMKHPIRMDGTRAGAVELSDRVWKYLESQLHPDALIYGPPDQGSYRSIAPETAMLWAIKLLKRKGAQKIEICEVHHIVTYLGAFIINGKFHQRKGFKKYSLFSIGIRDGSEGNAGAEFFFIAKGIDRKGEALWHPQPDLDSPEPDFGYKFLYPSRKEFESIPQRFK